MSGAEPILEYRETGIPYLVACLRCACVVHASMMTDHTVLHALAIEHAKGLLSEDVLAALRTDEPTA